jgi:hypothetical protein
MQVMSWWVGKGRDDFNAALKDHTERVMRRPSEPPASEPAASASVDVLERAAAAESTPAPALEEQPSGGVEVAQDRSSAEYQKDRRRRIIADGNCGGCGKPREHHASRCDECHEKHLAEQAARRGIRWRPGKSGTPPRWARPYVDSAKQLRRAIESTTEAQQDPELRNAAVIMACGFFLGQEIDWIVPFTGYPASDVRRIVRNLRRARIWVSPRRIACLWLQLFAPEKRLTKQQRGELMMALWLDALVAKGELTRETRAGEFYYWLVERGA